MPGCREHQSLNQRRKRRHVSEWHPWEWYCRARGQISDEHTSRGATQSCRVVASALRCRCPLPSLSPLVQNSHIPSTSFAPLVCHIGLCIQTECRERSQWNWEHNEKCKSPNRIFRLFGQSLLDDKQPFMRVVGNEVSSFWEEDNWMFTFIGFGYKLRIAVENEKDNQCAVQCTLTSSPTRMQPVKH